VETLLTQKDAAHLLGVSVRTLERHRVTGTGPRWARLGRLVRYRERDIAEWIEANVHSSTSAFDERRREVT
jgi:predicted DNA-binding transcriptional regulator AlpA